MLVVGDQVSGLLDFEFSAYDWRFMEIAVGLSKYVGNINIEPIFENYGPLPPPPPSRAGPPPTGAWSSRPLTPRLHSLITSSLASVDGYREGGGRLSPTELELVPDGIILRILSNVVYFAGRAVAGEDSIEALTGRVEARPNLSP